METRESASAYRVRAERRRRSRGTGEARGDGWVRTEADERLLAAATRYGTLTLRQAATAFWNGREETARARVRLMTEAGLLNRSAEVRWAGTVVWATERGARVAGVGLGAPHPPGERLLHRLALADVGLALEAKGRIVLTEREVRTAEASGRAAELLADLGVPGVHEGPREPLLAVSAGVRAVHWPDLVLVFPGEGVGAVEVELTAKTPSALRRILRAYGQARRRVLYLGTDPVVRQLQGRPGPDGLWIDGVGQDVGLLPHGGPDPGTEGLLRVRQFAAGDPAVDRQAARYAQRR
ncbi:hypothetical protein SLUN_38855 (plasmid) [Streptomyces lunaelactis]|uniref:Uncharacterized protein n=1 Tax=Streptomyces lunaelactis TaxID=1535768 RepID=A0A2R4TFT8_9ACTN|nr:hypothetical protein [Streptomyces lunaelactis]AVZ77991.1 hypothetical protein SLUN_38855 [Streptomyces lunaelactis]NUK84934.1 hypothetical protein [Streptomyces lunaelactis]